MMMMVMCDDLDGNPTVKELRKYGEQERDRHGNYMVDDNGIHNEFGMDVEFEKRGRGKHAAALVQCKCDSCVAYLKTVHVLS